MQTAYPRCVETVPLDSPGRLSAFARSYGGTSCLKGHRLRPRISLAAIVSRHGLAPCFPRQVPWREPSPYFQRYKDSSHTFYRRSKAPQPPEKPDWLMVPGRRIYPTTPNPKPCWPWPRHRRSNNRWWCYRWRPARLLRWGRRLQSPHSTVAGIVRGPVGRKRKRLKNKADNRRVRPVSAWILV